MVAPSPPPPSYITHPLPLPRSASQVQTSAERYNMTAPADRPETVQVSANVFAYSAMPDLLTEAQVRT